MPDASDSDKRASRRLIEKRYRDSHPEYRAKIAARVKAWKAAHPEKIHALYEKWYAKKKATREPVPVPPLLTPEEKRQRANENAKRRRREDPEGERLKDKRRREKRGEKQSASMKAWRAANRERVRASKKAWEQANPEIHKEGARKRNARWFARHEERVRKAWREQSAKWAAANPEKVATYRSREHAKRKARLRELETFTLPEWQELLDRTGHKCVCCGIPEAEAVYKYPKRGTPAFGQLTRDHIIPLSKGGSGTIENIQPLCLTCNTRKHNRTVNYLQQRQTQS